MKILHTSDWHLGQNFMGKSRAEEHEAFLFWLLEIIKKYTPIQTLIINTITPKKINIRIKERILI